MGQAWVVNNFVYVLISARGRKRMTYVGWTTDLERRLGQHNSGHGAKTTRGNVWALIYAERYQTRAEAMSREWFLKRDKAFRALLRGG